MSEVTTVWVPADAAAVSVGADEVAAAFEQIEGVRVRRNGSRGMLWLEPLVEVETDEGRLGFGNVSVDDVQAVLDGSHPGIGPVERHDFLAGQQRVSFARVGVIEPTDITGYAEHGGWTGLRRALGMDPADVVTEVTDSGLRGRGGAGFPAGVKWKTVAETPGELKFVCCNFDEGDSGTFADRMIAEGDPFTLIEGMTIAAYAVGAREGYLYIRSEYPHAIAALRRAIDVAYTHGYLGADVAGSGFAFDLFVRVGAGAYICGEESSMLESLEGKRGEVRAKPPIPAIKGLFGRPTAVNNVLTLCAVPMILADGGAAYADLGVGRSRGTQVFQLAGNITRGGIYETAFGITLRELIETHGGGTRTGRPVKAAQVGGPLGAWVPPSKFDTPMDYEAMAEAGAMVGHGGIVLADDSLDMARMARFAFEFCAAESCGKCTPCRIGSVRGVEALDRVLAVRGAGGAGATGENGSTNGHGSGTDARTDLDAQLTLVEDLCETMTKGSLCAMGGLTPMPVRSAMEHWPEDFGAPEATGGIDLDATTTDVAAEDAERRAGDEKPDRDTDHPADEVGSTT